MSSPASAQRRVSGHQSRPASAVVAARCPRRRRPHAAEPAVPPRRRRGGPSKCSPCGCRATGEADRRCGPARFHVATPTDGPSPLGLAAAGERSGAVSGLATVGPACGSSEAGGPATAASSRPTSSPIDATSADGASLVPAELGGHETSHGSCRRPRMRSHRAIGRVCDGRARLLGSGPSRSEPRRPPRPPDTAVRARAARRAQGGARSRRQLLALRPRSAEPGGERRVLDAEGPGGTWPRQGGGAVGAPELQVARGRGGDLPAEHLRQRP